MCDQEKRIFRLVKIHNNTFWRHRGRKEWVYLFKMYKKCTSATVSCQINIICKSGDAKWLVGSRIGILVNRLSKSIRRLNTRWTFKFILVLCMHTVQFFTYLKKKVAKQFCHFFGNSETSIKIHSPRLRDKVASGKGFAYRPVRLCSLAGRYDNPMPEPESTLSPRQGLRVWPKICGGGEGGNRAHHQKGSRYLIVAKAC